MVPVPEITESMSIGVQCVFPCVAKIRHVGLATHEVTRTHAHVNNMYKNACIHMHIHTYTHTHMHIHTYTHAHTHMHIHTYTHAHTHTCTHTHAHTHIHTCTHTYTHAHTHIHTCTYTHAHTHIHTHAYVCTHTHTHTHTSGRSWGFLGLLETGQTLLTVNVSLPSVALHVRIDRGNWF